LPRSLAVLVHASLLLTALAGLPAAAPAQQQNLPPDLATLRETFSDFLDVKAVHVDVVVTDEEGNRVPGLKAEDFRLLIEGEEMAIESFQEVRDREVVSASAGIPEDQALGNSYLIFIDEIFSQNHLRDEALQGIASDLRTLDPQDQVAIVAVNRERVQILSPWTRGGPALDDLLKRMIRHNGSLANSGLRLERPDTAGDRLLDAYQNHLDRLFAEQAIALGVVSNAQRELDPNEKALTAATSALRAFSGVRGRKSLLLLSGGWMEVPKPIKGLSFKNANSAALLQWLVDTASRLGFTVYPVYLVWEQGPGLIALIRHGSLTFTAVETGGKLLRSGRNKHVEKVIVDTSAYYRLGFTFTGDDKRRDIEVEVRRPGVKVRTPGSFAPLSRQAFVTQQVDSALLHGELVGMVSLTATAGELRKTADGRAELPVTVHIPIHEMTLLEQAGRRVGQLELRIAALADDGSRTVITAIPVWLVRDAEAPPPGEILRYNAAIEVEHKPQHVQVVLVDVISGRAFGGRIRVEPGR
jgi:VWFA-related protein